MHFLHFHLSDTLLEDLTIYIEPGGTATEGVDYAVLPDSIIIPAGTTTITLEVPIFDDNIDEGIETLSIISEDLNCKQANTVESEINILDRAIFDIAPDTTICINDSTEIWASGGLSFLWLDGDFDDPTDSMQLVFPYGYHLLSCRNYLCNLY